MSLMLLPAHTLRQSHDIMEKARAHVLQKLLMDISSRVQLADAQEEAYGDFNSRMKVSLHYCVADTSSSSGLRCCAYVQADARTGECQTCWVDAATHQNALVANPAISFFRVFDILSSAQTFQTLKKIFNSLGYRIDVSHSYDSSCGEMITIDVLWTNACHKKRNHG